MLRPSLVPGMLAMVAGNLHRDVGDVRLFEMGTVFGGTTEKVDEHPALAFGAAGALAEQSALHSARSIDFYDVKGVVEQVLARFQMRSVYFDRFPSDAGLTPALASSLSCGTGCGRRVRPWAGSARCTPARPPRANSKSRS